MKRNFLYRTLFVGLLTTAASWSAVASNTDQRLSLLERSDDAQSQVINQMQRSLSNLQSDVDQLRGELQTSQYQLKQAIDRQKKLYLQIEELQKSIEGKDTPAEVNTTNSKTPAASVPASTGNEEQDYTRALNLATKDKLYDEAINAFQAFLKKYPNSEKYAPNANYWLGQLLYNKGEKDSASYFFAVVVKNYPKSPKASDAMYKVAVIMQDKQDFSNAKAIYQQLIKQYPGSTAAEQATKQLQLMP